MVSRWFRPPELLEANGDRVYDGRVDMYSLALTAYFLQNQKPLFSGETPVLLKMYKRHKPCGLYKHLVCDYEDRFTSEQLLKYCGVVPIEGSESELPYRTGTVAKFARLLRGGYDENAKKFIFGKLNSLYTIRLGFGHRKILYEKLNIFKTHICKFI